MDFEARFDTVAKKMLLDFEEIRKNIEKKPSVKGEIVENTLYRFLEEYFPRSLGIATGFIVDVDGNETKQLDIIIFDSFKTPVFMNSDKIRVVPIECVYAVIEVKTEINDRDLEEIFQNMLSVKSLEKKAFIPRYTDARETWNVYGTDREIWPVNYYVFAFDSKNLESIKSKIEEYNYKNHLPIWQRIDAVCILKKGIICNYTMEEKITLLPDNNTHLKVLNTDMALVVLYGLLSNLFTAGLPNFVALNYIRKIPL